MDPGVQGGGAADVPGRRVEPARHLYLLLAAPDASASRRLRPRRRPLPPPPVRHPGPSLSC
eukprot:3789297-Rhodomonas_salina.6